MTNMAKQLSESTIFSLYLESYVNHKISCILNIETFHSDYYTTLRVVAGNENFSDPYIIILRETNSVLNFLLDLTTDTDAVILEKYLNLGRFFNRSEEALDNMLLKDINIADDLKLYISLKN